MRFRIIGLPAERFAHLFAMSDAELAAAGRGAPHRRRARAGLSLPRQPHRFQARRR